MATYDQSDITYSEPLVSYAGTLIINVEGLSNPIILNNINVITNTRQDYSNASTIGVMSIDYAPTGVVTLEVVSNQTEILFNSLESIKTFGQIVVKLV